MTFFILPPSICQYSESLLKPSVLSPLNLTAISQGGEASSPPFAFLQPLSCLLTILVLSLSFLVLVLVLLPLPISSVDLPSAFALFCSFSSLQPRATSSTNLDEFCYCQQPFLHPSFHFCTRQLSIDLLQLRLIPASLTNTAFESPAFWSRCGFSSSGQLVLSISKSIFDKMSSASGTQTPHSREHSERTASTDFSPEVLRFKHLSISSDPFTSAPLSPEARPFEPGPVRRFVPPNPDAFSTIIDSIQKCPLPDPYVDLRVRMHNGTNFAQMANGEPLTCFVWTSGEQHVSSYLHGGEYSWVSQAASQSLKHPQLVSC